MHFLGKAASQPQLQTMTLSCAGWFAVQAMSRKLSPIVAPVYSKLSHKDRGVWDFTVAALLHSVVACGLASDVVLNPDEVFNTNPIYGESSRAQFADAVSAGYFLWDFLVVITADKLDVAFLVHSVACFFCYLFGQYPFLNYTGCWFLLFELSTPFLNVRQLLLLAGRKDTPLYSIVQSLFGVTFMVARILVGLPVSAMFWKDMVQLLLAGKQHNTFVVVYYFVANIALNALNVLWAVKLVKKFFAKKSLA